MTVTKGRRTPVEFDLLAQRGEGVLASAFSQNRQEHNDAARERVIELAERWRHRRCDEVRHHCETYVRGRYNERLVLAELGLATEEEEQDVWWRYCMSRLNPSAYRSEE